MTLLLDTSVLIDHLRGDAGAQRALTEAVDRGDRLACSVVTKVELLAGMRPGEESATRRLFGVIGWLAVDDSIAERAGLLANRYLKSHPGVDPVDYIVAATAEEHDAVLWTRNLKQFPMFESLATPY